MRSLLLVHIVIVTQPRLELSAARPRCTQGGQRRDEPRVRGPLVLLQVVVRFQQVLGLHGLTMVVAELL
eukprot:11163471-Lingulodinium_polyedra.AAC.1